MFRFLLLFAVLLLSACGTIDYTIGENTSSEIQVFILETQCCLEDCDALVKDQEAEAIAAIISDFGPDKIFLENQNGEGETYGDTLYQLRGDEEKVLVISQGGSAQSLSEYFSQNNKFQVAESKCNRLPRRL